MSFPIMTYQPVGDKKNSDFFNDYRLKIYQRRQSSGIEDLLENICALVVQVETGDALAYMEELYLMTPFRFESAYLNATHKIYIMQARPEWPRYIVLEPLDKSFRDDLTRLNMLYPLASKKPNARYVGEVFRTRDLTETRNILETHNIRFHYADETENKFFSNPHFNFTQPSSLTGNRVGYMPMGAFEMDQLDLGQKILLRKSETEILAKAADKAAEKGTGELLLGVDHMATRILSGEREDAILEFLSMSNYYFWGAYNIAEQNSSTNVNRHPNVDDDKFSPAKVFTANNIPSFVNSFENLPMPTEDFVRNYGRRMHHIAYEVKDGDHLAGEKNIDFVVDTLKSYGLPFLANVVGECTDKPNLKQIFSQQSQYSLLITEYVERCHGFDGFFTKENVAALTQAAGALEQYHHGNIFD